MGEKRGCVALESWCRTMTAGYKDVNITNMTSSWKNGLAFCALIHHFRPDLIDFSSLSAENVYHNNHLAFTVAEQHLGIPALLDAEDMVACSSPDRLSILTYLSQFYQVFAGSKGGSPIKRPATSVSSAATPSNRDSISTGGATPTKDTTLEMRGQPFKAELFARQLQLENVTSPYNRRTPDLCVSCKNPVFLAERLMVNGRLHHRVCFRCARCKSQLSVANYYETENDQYCCETCPDEVTITPATVEETKTIADHKDNHDSISTAAETASGLDGRYESMQQPERLPSAQEKHFLNSMLNKTDPIVIVEVTPQAVPSVDKALKNLEDSYDERIETSVNSQDAANVPPVEDAANVPETESVENLSSYEDASKVSAPNVQVSSEGNVVLESVVNQGETCDEGSKGNDEDADVPIPQTLLQDTLQMQSIQAATNDKADQETLTVSDDEMRDGKSPNVVDASLDQISRQSVLSKDENDLKPEEECAESFPTDESVLVSDETQECNTPLGEVPSPERSAQETPRVVPLPRQRKGKKGDSLPDSAKKTPENQRDIDYPEELNPFDDDDSETPSTDNGTNPRTGDHGPGTKVILPAPKISLNPFGSDDEDDEDNSSSIDPGGSVAKDRPTGKPVRPPPPVIKSPQLNSSADVTPSPKKRTAPAPPAKPPRTPNMSSPGGGEALPTTLRRKAAPAPPPPLSDSPSPAPRTMSMQPSSSPQPKPRLLSVNTPTLPPLSRSSDKEHKDMSNLHLQTSSTNKDSHGQWKRKKGPAPPRPSPQKRQLRKLPLKVIQQELEDIEVKQVELERQGVALEENIRALTEPEDGSDSLEVAGNVHVEEMILQLFDLVNEKNELLRRQTELMYIRRQQRLEEEHAELEFQIRVLMDLPSGKKTDEDRLREEELITRLVEVVHRRAEIVDCLEMDRRRQEEEDKSIQQHLDVFNSRGATAGSTQDVTPPKSKSKGLKMIPSPIKAIKKEKKDKQSKKSKKSSKVDDDKDVDEAENDGSSTAQSATTLPKQPKEKDKNKSKLWFNK